MKIETQFDVGDETKQGKVFSIVIDVNQHGGYRIQYWTVNGSRFYAESELVAKKAA